MRKIFKYEVHPENPGGITNLSLPHGALPLAVDLQRGTVMVWFEVIPTRPANWHVEIVARATGQEWEASDRGQYLGTVLSATAESAYHLYLRDS